MNWHETILHIRTKPEYSFLVEKAYFEADLPLNVERFKNEEEFKETLKLLQKHAPNAKTILDIGAGNGISSVAFALAGYQVTVVEPDPSDTVGAEAIRILKKYYKLENLEIFEAFAEEIKFPDNNFDVVYARQCMHHAYDLDKFVAESSRVLKKDGVFMTIRDHVVFGEKDKQWFLEMHLLQKYYGGENAFSPDEYKNAMQKAGLELKEEIKHYENVVNFFPANAEDIKNHISNQYAQRKKFLVQKVGFLANIPPFIQMYNLYLDVKVGKIKPLDENNVAGRMYSYVCTKK